MPKREIGLCHAETCQIKRRNPADSGPQVRRGGDGLLARRVSENGGLLARRVSERGSLPACRNVGR
jgi:hypothetical protein